MELKLHMPRSLKPFFSEELEMASKALENTSYLQEWRHLERAHILGQPYPLEHTVVHWKMLRFAIRIKSSKEIIGQLPRLLVGGVKSFVGVIPVGNTGGADVPPLRAMEIPKELASIIDQHKI